MEQSPSWEANLFTASREIPRILWNPKVHYRIQKCPPTFLILSHPNPVHRPTSHFLNINLTIILPSTPGFSKWSLSLRFTHYKPSYASLLLHMCYMPRLSHYFRRDEPNNNEWAVQIIKPALCISLHSPVTSSLLGPNILLNTLFSYTLSLRSSLNLSDQVPHPFRITGKITVLYILIFKFLDSKLEDKRFCTLRFNYFLNKNNDLQNKTVLFWHGFGLTDYVCIPKYFSPVVTQVDTNFLALRGNRSETTTAIKKNWNIKLMNPVMF